MPSPSPRVLQSPGFGGDFGGDFAPPPIPLYGSESVPPPKLLLQHGEVCAALLEQQAARHTLANAITTRTAAELDEQLARSRMDAANDRHHSALKNYVELMGALIADQMERGSKLVLPIPSCGKGKGKPSGAHEGNGKDCALTKVEPEGKGKGRAPPADKVEEDGTPEDKDDEDEDMYSLQI